MQQQRNERLRSNRETAELQAHVLELTTEVELLRSEKEQAMQQRRSLLLESSALQEEAMQLEQTALQSPRMRENIKHQNKEVQRLQEVIIQLEADNARLASEVCVG